MRSTRSAATGGKKGGTGTPPVPQQPPKPRGKYALVLYDTKTLGVVETESLGAAVNVGDNVLAPEPVEWEQVLRGTTKTPAKLVAFGHNINFLYGLRVNVLTSQLLGDDSLVASDDTLLAKRKKKEATLRKNQNVVSFNAAAESLQSVFGSESGENASQSCIVGKTLETASVLQKKGLQYLLEVISKHLPAKNNTEPSDERIELDRKFIDEIVAVAGQSILDHRACGCPSNPNSAAEEGITKSASGSVSQENASKDPAPSTSTATQAVNSGQNSSSVAGLPSSAAKVLYYADLRGVHQKRSQVHLPCYDEGSDEMTQLVDYCPVYISKVDKANLPWVLPRDEAEKKQKKPKLDGAVFPKELVSILLKILVPWDTLQTFTGSTLPLKLYNSIKAYINIRLPLNRKLSDTTLNDYITEGIREMKKNIKKLPAEAFTGVQV